MTPWRSDREAMFTPLRPDERELFPERSSQNEAEQTASLELQRVFGEPSSQCGSPWVDSAEQSPMLPDTVEMPCVDESDRSEPSASQCATSSTVQDELPVESNAMVNEDDLQNASSSPTAEGGQVSDDVTDVA